MKNYLKAFVQGIIETACDNNSDTPANHDTMRLSVLLTADQLHHLINWLRSLVDCENLDKVRKIDQCSYFLFAIS